jgi:hypothetical protein
MRQVPVVNGTTFDIVRVGSAARHLPHSFNLSSCARPAMCAGLFPARVSFRVREDV